jgi:DNA polymerase IV
MADRPTEALWGIGRKTATKLAALGLHTVAQLAQADPAELATRFGPSIGPWLQRLAAGDGDTVVSAAPWVARSRSRETTFARDLTDRADIEAQVVSLARELVESTVTPDRPVARVAVKVRFAPFFTQTRIMKLPSPTVDTAEIEQAALTVLDRFRHTRPVRLLGVRVEFVPPTRPGS